ncbi:phosphatase PAP2 family protein [Maribacter polysiphoniae]|uniref:Phosphatase PAP2 family protein n=1 Tax=Maribacter polysiphoniae TaxID=429344 RepID=A0A316DN88_9FLAO|nr:phosphatase PAP2 family protein [Maribacter polysiphoniae]MBD1262978.1 phosphatase PAP2 family protein [Maribacter polysiphoniae]PWK19395.1 undecaprenyl-diphosphatase [Maribacter polysiphoniae]
MLERILQWDRETLIYLNSLGIEEYDHFWSTVTNIYTWIPLFLFFFVLIFWKYKRREAIFVTLTVLALIGFILVATDVTKGFFERIRPNNDEEVNQLIRILHHPSTFSFFSGHSASSFSITTLIVLFLRKRVKWCWVFYIWPLLFALSRIYVGVHYPGDIIVGALVGAGSAFLFYNLYTRIIVPYLGLAHP